MFTSSSFVVEDGMKYRRYRCRFARSGRPQNCQMLPEKFIHVGMACNAFSSDVTTEAYETIGTVAAVLFDRRIEAACLRGSN